MITNDIKIAATYIKNKKPIVFKTDTLYAIGGDIYSEDVFNEIYKIKNRPQNKSLIVLIENLKNLNNLVDNITDLEKKLCDNFWPGPLTIVFKANKNIPKHLKNDDNTIAVRMPNNKQTLELIKLSNTQLLAPSANKSGVLPENDIIEIQKIFKNEISLFLKSKEKNKNNEASTIVKCINNEIKIIREGKIKKEDLQKII